MKSAVVVGRRGTVGGWLLTAMVVLPGVLPAQDKPPHRDAKLEAALRQATDGFHGDVGVYVHHLRSGRTAELRADEAFPTASMIKVPILATYYDRLASGAMDLHATEVMPDTAIYGYPDDLGLVGNLKPGAKVEHSLLALMMITTSDNTAAIWMQSLVGGGEAVNGWLAGRGFDSTRVNSRTPGREAARARYGWGQTTPREMATLFTKIRAGEVVSPAASEEMYRALTRIYWNGEALSQLPPWIQAASKQGEVDHSRSETVLVNGPSGDYVFSIITKNQADTTYAPNNEAYLMIRRVSALLWKAFEPRMPYVPAPGAAAFKP
jgi:beta-lactamase class A